MGWDRPGLMSNIKRQPKTNQNPQKNKLTKHQENGQGRCRGACWLANFWVSTKRPQRFSITATCSRRLLVSLPSLLSLVTSGQRLCSTARDAPSFSFRACLIVSSPPRSRSPLPSRSISISPHSSLNSAGERHDEMNDADTRSRSEWRPKIWGDPSR